MTKTILIIGASGKQGRHVIAATLSALPDAHILALTRNPASASSQALLQKHPAITLVAGNLDDPTPLFTPATPIWGVFSVQVAIGDGASPAREEAQGRALIDAALAHGVSHFVYNSAARHDSTDAVAPTTGVPALDVKIHIEEHLKRRCAEAGAHMTWTILRPAVFCENLSSDIVGKVFATNWRDAIQRKLQVVSTVDIGCFAAQAFARPREWAGRELGLAGDELTFAEADQVFREVVGKPMPTTYWWFGWAVFNLFVKELGVMYAYFQSHALNCDVQAVRAEYPAMMTWRAWVEQSEFAQK